MSGRLLTLTKTLPIVDEEIATGFTIVTRSRLLERTWIQNECNCIAYNARRNN